MNDGVYFLRFKEVRHFPCIAQVEAVKGWLPARDLSDGSHHFFPGITQVVKEHHGMALLEQFHGRMRPDVTRSPGDKYIHAVIQKNSMTSLLTSEAPVAEGFNLSSVNAFGIDQHTIGCADAQEVFFVELQVFRMIHGDDDGVVVAGGLFYQPEAVLCPEIF